MADLLTNAIFSTEIWIICSILTALTVAWLTLAVLYVKARTSVTSTTESNYTISAQIGAQPPYFVSVIVPARNEEAYIKRCLSSLLSQRYPTFQVIMIDDCSTDKTLRVALAIRDKRLKVIQLKKTPEGWSGKSWASHVGYLASDGQILLFTDADSFYYNKFAIVKSVSLMRKEKVDAITGSPLIELRDFYSKLIMPLFNVFSVFRSPNSVLRSDKTKSRYLIGSFFMINKTVLDKIGGFRTVSSSVQEDTDLGKRIERAGYSIELVRINNLVSAAWSRNKRTLLNGIKRIVSYNLKTSNNINLVVDISTILFMVILPFIILPFSLQSYDDNKDNSSLLALLILLWNLSLCLSPILGVSLKGLKKYRLNPIYSVLILFAASFLLTVYLASLLSMSFPVSRTIRWKGRKYAYL
jgi:chlorobactene glucosyltransferase